MVHLAVDRFPLRDLSRKIKNKGERRRKGEREKEEERERPTERKRGELR